MPDDHRGRARTVQYAHVHPHPRARLAVRVVGDAAGHPRFHECAGSVVHIQQIPLRIVRRHQVRPAIFVEIPFGGAQRLAGGGQESGLGGPVRENAALVSVKTAGNAIVQLGRTVGFVAPVHGAPHIGLRGPGDIIRYVQIKLPIQVCVEKDGGRTPGFVVRKPRRLRRVAERNLSAGVRRPVVS